MKPILKFLPVLILTGCISVPETFTPLQDAALNGDKAKVQQLLAAGANVNERGAYGTFALPLAAGSGHMEIVKILLDAGADMKVESTGGYTALSAAAAGGHTTLVKFLLERGAGNKESALLSAAAWGKTDTVRWLLENGASVYAKNLAGETALELAKKNKNTATVDLIQSVISQQMTALVNSATLPQLLAQDEFSNEALVGLLTDKLIEAKNRELPGLISTSNLDQRITLVTTVEKRLADAQTAIVELTGKAEDAVRKGQDSSGYRRHIGKLQAYMAVLAEMKNMLMQS